MRLDYLQRILGHVKKGLTCPRCQKEFGGAEIKVLSIREAQLDLSVHCPHCGTNANISAAVTTQKKRLVRGPAKTSAADSQVTTKAHITPESVEQLKRGISRLSAGDIEEISTEK